MSEAGNEEITDYAEDEYCNADGNAISASNGESIDKELEPEEMQKKVLEMEAELAQVTEMQQQVEKQISSTSDSVDESSIYVGQVDYEASSEELRAHFAPCGTINRITIVTDKFSQRSKGFAYIEFVDKEAVENALKLNDSEFKGRQLKVLPKRQNVPFARGGRGGRGGFRGTQTNVGPVFAGRGRGRFGGGYMGPSAGYRGSGFRGGRGGWRGANHVGGRFPGGGRGRSTFRGANNFNPFY